MPYTECMITELLFESAEKELVSYFKLISLFNTESDRILKQVSIVCSSQKILNTQDVLHSIVPTKESWCTPVLQNISGMFETVSCCISSLEGIVVCSLDSSPAMIVVTN